jgi:hypothetical protein
MSLLKRPNTVAGLMNVTDAPMMDKLNLILGGSTNVNVMALCAPQFKTLLRSPKTHLAQRLWPWACTPTLPTPPWIPQ